ncbi:S-type pyocin domain-containing protein [Pseudomonas capsici]|uniref:S-type pyocin domain-containing protein n=1 Tax=Pseudomonas capsici TaxID=2810614 RepID=A0ABT3BQM7_9PSED|nr:S-type pyocin domain-containing protein [Pseudomonas capsici]MBX8607360.1 S-type pyocin domain-containing protein [Pseudomonas cichorii]MBN6712531.1 S-type pyocin domain-containing protein [Pseudomonas capsici]MBN6717732.1 S-type pyocin domain-containing protein [Pseudomonas capsici]MBN6723217.1 S-type pyocin domain-containing protein [Pseudomonas capsici]MCV4267121.1 S-type pyocin domain-containing protein [Pseudomonas capsici]
MAFVIREGDPTTTGGNVVKGSTSTTIEFKKAARISDPVWCPKCSSMGFIAEGNPTFIDESVAIATHGHAVQCGCPFGSNRLISTQTSAMAAEDASVAIAPEFAAQAQAATHLWAKAISDGSYKSEFTTGIPTNNLSGYKPPKLCVFAKTCTVPPESTEAGTVIEPVANFGQTVVMGSTGIASTEGGVALGRVAGQALIETLGTWSLRGAAVVAGTAASTLLLALLPTSMGDSTLTEKQLRGMTLAPTRVRFQFRRDAEGVMRVYGIHTSATSGMESVPVVDVSWNKDRSAMEARLNGITVIWTPNNGTVVQAPTTYPGVTNALESILVHPVAENTDSQIEVYPGSDDLTWQDCILVFPIDSGVPPLYLVFAKPMVNPLEVGIYSDLSSRSRRDGLDIDHIPAQAALKKYILANYPELPPEIIADYLRKAPSIAIPTRVHQKYSETYGGRNIKEKQARDAENLRAAVDSNFDAIKPGLLEEGLPETEIEASRAELHKLHEEQGWY